MNYESKGKTFGIIPYSVDLITKHIDELMKVDEVISGYPSSSNKDIKSISASQSEDKWTLKNFTYPLPEKENLSFIVLHNNKAVAYLIASTYANGTKSHLNRIATLDAFQGYGIGSKLIELLESQSKKLGMKAVTVSTMYDEEKNFRIPMFKKRHYRILETEEQVENFLKEKGKEKEFHQFWPWNKKGNLVVLRKEINS